MTTVLLVPDLPIEHWPSMDRYASRLVLHLRRLAPDLDIALAGEISGLTMDQSASDGRGLSSTARPGASLSSTATPQPQPAGMTARAPLFPSPGLDETRRYLARYWSYPHRIRRMESDIVHVLDHSYAHILLSPRTRPYVVTVHDLLPVLTVERGGGGLRNRIRNRLLERVLEGLRLAAGWIVATEWLRGELARWLGRADGIHVIPYGVDDAFFNPPVEPRSDRRRRLSIPDSALVVLHVGSVGPRKNVPAVMAAVQGLRKNGTDAWLLQVGGGFSPEQTRDLERHQLRAVTRCVGEATESQLHAAYHAADVLLFPSHYEGFGLPLLEAMASGVPVVTSGAGGLAEVAGDAAVVVGGRESEPYVTALGRLAGNPTWRAQLVERGLARARQFRWTETARQTAEVYRSLARS